MENTQIEAMLENEEQDSKVKKKVSVSDIAKAINKAWKNNTLTTGSMIPQCKRFSMGTISADFALYGGLPEGKCITFAGESGSGKSLAACAAMAKYQQAHPDKVCVYVDVEETLVGQVGWISNMTGLNVDENFLRYDCAGKAAEEIFSDIIQLQNADDIGMIIIDSAPMLMTKADIDNDITKDNGQRASVAKPMGKFLKFMVPAIAKAGNPLLIINHTRVVGTTFTGAKIYAEPCGYGLQFYPSVKVRFANRKFTSGDKLDISQSQVDEKTDGICVIFSVTKNRLGPTNRNGAKLIFRYDSGVDTITDLIEIITKYEIAKLDGKTWYLVDPFDHDKVYNDEDGKPLKFVGKPKLVRYIKEHDEFRKMYEKRVSDFINKTGTSISLVDADSLAEIIAAEKCIDEQIKKYEEGEKDFDDNNDDTKKSIEVESDDDDDENDDEKKSVENESDTDEPSDEESSDDESSDDETNE